MLPEYFPIVAAIIKRSQPCPTDERLEYFLWTEVVIATAETFKRDFPNTFHYRNFTAQCGL